MRLEGVFAPLTTPFAADGTVAIDRLRENVSRYNRTRLAGFVAMGSTGEAVLLSRDEVERVWVTVRETAGANKILIAGTGAESTAETIERTARAASIGYQAALVKPPYYYKPILTAQVLIEHFERVADAARIPLLLYSVPQFTGVAFEAPLVARLAEHPNIIGIKESSGNVQRIGEIVQSAPRTFQTLVGSAATIHPSVAVGACGCILALACVLPDLCIELFELARAGDVRRALSLQQNLIPVSKKIVSEGGAPGVKYAMDLLGYSGGAPRRPLLPPAEAYKKEIEGVLSVLKGIPAGSAHG
ncbi:MAG TPA: 4-hydroxy-tetrahydrodipicolinate synthase [Candidatus Dormibacteraeota bacterium]|nr:4-hydroxy-tetrahydrodipicolinate synthase [Candidatus Dormibacteraeota bacterium]